MNVRFVLQVEIHVDLIQAVTYSIDVAVGCCCSFVRCRVDDVTRSHGSLGQPVDREPPRIDVSRRCRQTSGCVGVPRHIGFDS